VTRALIETSRKLAGYHYRIVGSCTGPYPYSEWPSGPAETAVRGNSFRGGRGTWDCEESGGGKSCRGTAVRGGGQTATEDSRASQDQGAETGPRSTRSKKWCLQSFLRWCRTLLENL